MALSYVIQTLKIKCGACGKYCIFWEWSTYLGIIIPSTLYKHQGQWLITNRNLAPLVPHVPRPMHMQVHVIYSATKTLFVDVHAKCTFPSTCSQIREDVVGLCSNTYTMHTCTCIHDSTYWYAFHAIIIKCCFSNNVIIYSK